MSSAELRIIDASFNRAAEGLRVVEDYARFVLDDRHLAKELKDIRHGMASAVIATPLAGRYAARDTMGDVGTTITVDSERARDNAWYVCRANCERVKQSLRSLEEYAKCIDPQTASAFETLRYGFYEVEAALRRTFDSGERLVEVTLMVLVDGGETRQKFFEIIDPLIAARVGAIQLRDKRLSDLELHDRAQLLVAACRGVVAPAVPPLVIINDRPDIAAAADADGVHLGQDDLPVSLARRIVGSRKLIGASTHSIEQARLAVRFGADYLGAGPTFPSTTKSFDAFPGLDFLREVAAEISLPTFAIGGITADNIAAVRATGITRVAVSGAVTGADDPSAAVRRLL